MFNRKINGAVTSQEAIDCADEYIRLCQLRGMTTSQVWNAVTVAHNPAHWPTWKETRDMIAEYWLEILLPMARGKR